MKTKKCFWAIFPMMAAALMMTACSSDEDNTSAKTTPADDMIVKTIPYTVTVGKGNTTRATVADDNVTLQFATGDKLYVQNADGSVYGCLDLQSGTGEANATFSGDLYYTGSEPTASTELNATLVGESNALLTISGNKVTGYAYPTTSVCVPNGTSSAINEAIKKYSLLTGTSTYSAASFALTQQTAFLNFAVTYHDGSLSGSNVDVTFANGGITACTGSAQIAYQGSKVGEQARFVIPVESGTTLSGASITMGSSDAMTFGGSTELAGGIYNVNKTILIPEPAGAEGVQLWAGGPYWATMNIGATSEEDYGLMFAWGETTGYNSNITTGRGYRGPSENYSISGSKTKLEAIDDAATSNWGGSWRMPTLAELKTLINKDNSGKVSLYKTDDYKQDGTNIKGYIITGTEPGYTNKSIFLPAAGYRKDEVDKYDNVGHHYCVGENCDYWASTFASNDYAHFVDLVHHSVWGTVPDLPWGDDLQRYYRISVRAVHD